MEAMEEKEAEVENTEREEVKEETPSVRMEQRRGRNSVVNGAEAEKEAFTTEAEKEAPTTEAEKDKIKIGSIE